MTLVAQKFEGRGPLAINPTALNETFIVDTAPRENVEVDGCCIVDIRGPLQAHKHPMFDSYEAIYERVQAACKTGARAVILRFDSPGGDVTQCFDTALAVRACTDAAGKQLHAYAVGECASAAYAFASQCQSITISLSSIVGSVGILSTREDISVANAVRGIRVALVMSGARKGDGHPESPISEAELESAQAIVDSLASTFFDLVSQGRGVSPENIAALQARTFHGDAAVQAGLADAVGPLTTVLAMVASGGTGMAITAKKPSMSYGELRDALAAAAEGDDPNAAACKAALAAMSPSEGEPDGDEPAKDPEKKDDAPPPAAASASAPTDDEKKREEEAAAASALAASAAEGTSAAAAYKMAMAAEAKATKLQALLAQRDEEAERARLIDSRSDLSEDMQSLLRKAPIALVREHVASLPEIKPTAGTIKNPLVARAGKAAQGKDGAATSQLPPAEKAALDARMGLNQGEPGVVSTDYKLSLGAYKTSA